MDEPAQASGRTVPSHLVGLLNWVGWDVPLYPFLVGVVVLLLVAPSTPQPLRGARRPPELPSGPGIPVQIEVSLVPDASANSVIRSCGHLPGISRIATPENLSLAPIVHRQSGRQGLSPAQGPALTDEAIATATKLTVNMSWSASGSETRAVFTCLSSDPLVSKVLIPA